MRSNQASQSPEALRESVSSISWYHTLDLAPGVVTRGWFDTRRVPDLVKFPPSLSGQRCLDVGTFDGFWAFEMEQRGAAEVVAVDLLDAAEADWPANSPPEAIAAIVQRKGTGSGFEIAREALGSQVKRLELNVYDLDPAQVGSFDFVYIGSLLLHLRDPIRALERVRAVCRGRLMVVDAIDLALTVLAPRRAVAGLDGLGRPWWWKPNLAGLARMVEAAGFTVSEGPRRFWMPPGEDQVRMGSLSVLRSRGGRDAALSAWKGDPHAVLVARPGSSGVRS